MTHQRSNYWKPVTSAWVGNVVPTKAYRLAAVNFRYRIEVAARVKQLHQPSHPLSTRKLEDFSCQSSRLDKCLKSVQQEF
ncbi:hypothetical protein NC651_021947 [Populus alba x Populus x berolinensis]|nr:hypothetical protein NC651_021947 [Populus alba x Populus x berolinensis]